MKVVQVSNTSFSGPIYGDLAKGKKAYEALSPTEQAIKTGIEMSRQNFNRNNVGFKLSAPNNDLNGYIKFKVAIANAIKKTTEKYRKS